MNRLLGILLLIFLFACGESKEIKYLTGEVVREIDTPGLDSLNYFGRIEGISCNDRNLLISDGGNCRLILMNLESNKSVTIGNCGKGPGEFVGIGKAILYENYILANDVGSRRIQIFDISGNPVQMIRDIHLSIFQRVSLLTKNEIVIPNYNADNLFVVMNIEIGSLSGFGSPIQFDNDKMKNRLRNTALTESDDNQNVYLAFFEYPEIRKYKNGKLLWKTNLESIEEIKTLYEKNKLKIKEDQGFGLYGLLINMRYNAGKLYIYSPFEDEDGKRIDFIVINSLTGNIIEFLSIDDEKFSAFNFDITGNKIFATGFNNTIKIAEIKNK